MKKISTLLENINAINTIHYNDVMLEGIAFDSRKVCNNSLFVATKGTSTDGHDYIETAIEKGAKAIVCENLPNRLDSNITYIKVNDSAEALGIIASNWYDKPSQKLKLVGVTGTNGKTTIATLLYRLFKHLNYSVGLLSTVCNYINETAIASTHTTPDAISLNSLLNDMVKAGCTHAFMEVSSHAIDQKRISGLIFVGGIFSNITRDHIDYHKTFDAYIKAKKAFFDMLPSSAFALTNLDDKNGLVMVQNTKATVYTFATKTLANYKARIIEQSFEGMLLEINNRELSVSFIGKFNASNLLAVYGASALLGINIEEILVGLSVLVPVSGRFETMHSPNGYTAIVDYAHTPDALSNVLDTIQSIRLDNAGNNSGMVITVVGCGGNRDKGKRPLMAQEAIRKSDKVIFTSDNPRFENPTDILNDMIAGLTSNEKKQCLIIEDRRQAIHTACMLANKNDIILVAGKGHENYQEIAGIKHHFDDKEVLATIFSQS